MSHFLRALQISVLMSAAFAASGCIDEKLVPLEQAFLNRQGYATVEANLCLLPPDVYRQRLKYIFVMDKSSSNQNLPDATDPSGFRRYAPLATFLQDMVEDPGYTYYSLINFSTTAQVVQGFTDDMTAFQGVVDSQWNRLGAFHPQDLGYTNYLSAIDAAHNLIEADVEQTLGAAVLGPSITTVYVVIYVSDGAPVVPLPGGEIMTQESSAILAKIDTLRNLRKDPKYVGAIDDIIFHTGYYYNLASPDVDAESLLADMAAQGTGKAYSFGSGVNIDYSLFAVPVRKVRHLFSDLLIENRQAVWWDDGKFMRDSDMDGLPDSVENQAASNPDLADSDGNGVSDLVEYRLKGKPCKESGCRRDVSLRDNYAMCMGLASSVVPDEVNAAPYGTYVIPDGDHDGLNDCEELLLGSVADQFDSNLDGVPDFLAFKNRLPFIPGVNFSQSDGDGDGMSNYGEIKFGMSLTIPNDKLVNFKRIVYHMFRAAPPSGVDTECFNVRLENVATMGPDNLMRLYLTENTSVIDNKKILRVGEARLQSFSDRIQLANEEFH